MIEWVFIRGVTEHFHDGALFLGRSAAPLLVQEAGGNRLLWTQSLDWGGGGVNWDERRNVNNGEVQTMGQTGTGAENRREEMSHITAVSRVLVKILLEQLHLNNVF